MDVGRSQKLRMVGLEGTAAAPMKQRRTNSPMKEWQLLGRQEGRRQQPSGGSTSFNRCCGGVAELQLQHWQSQLHLIDNGSSIEGLSETRRRAELHRMHSRAAANTDQSSNKNEGWCWCWSTQVVLLLLTRKRELLLLVMKTERDREGNEAVAWPEMEVLLAASGGEGISLLVVARCCRQ